MAETKVIFSVVAFIGLLGLLSLSFFGASYEVARLNQNSTLLGGNATFLNTTIATGTGTQAPVCSTSGGLFGGIPVINDISNFFGCFSANVVWLYQFVFLDSDTLWLRAILLGASAVFVWIIVRAVKPGGT